MFLFNTLESEDSYEDLESIISKVRENTLSSYQHFFAYLILFIFVLFIHLPQHTALPTSSNYIAVSVDLICFRF